MAKDVNKKVGLLAAGLLAAVKFLVEAAKGGNYLAKLALLDARREMSEVV